MFIERIILNNFRLFRQLHFEPKKGINLITGNNGSGKTTILEAIYFIVRNRSFRTSNTSSLIRHNSPELTISARIKSSKDLVQNIEINKSRSLHHLTVNGAHQRKVSDIAMMNPLGIITTQINQLIDDGPKARRRYIDWSMFHVEQDYLKLVNIYQNLLVQRNSSLRQHLKTVDVWNNQIEKIGNLITDIRVKHMQLIKSIFLQLADHFLPDYDISFDFYQGWKKNLTLTQALIKIKETDLKRGYTTIGPHRSDIHLSINGKKIQDVLSNGEKKILGCLMILANLRNIQCIENEFPILLCDDVFTELDNKNIEILANILIETGYQIFITTNDERITRLPTIGKNMFHVEHG